VARLTRAESQERTKALILEAATALFLRDGFRHTSVEQIAAAAGFTVGAVYSNFGTKAEVGIAVIDALYEREMQRFVGEDAGTSGDVASLLAAVADWRDSILGDPSVFRLELEVSVLIGDDNALQSRNAARFGRLSEFASELLARVETDSGLALPIPRETLALALVALVLGIGVQRASDPRISPDVLGEVVAALLGTAG